MAIVTALRFAVPGEPKPRPLTETQIQRGLEQAVRALGGATYHNLYAVGSDPGYPDLTVWLPGGVVVWLECKGPNGKVSEKQVAWLERLARRAWVVWPIAEKVEASYGKWPTVEHWSYDRTLDILAKAVFGKDRTR